MNVRFREEVSSLRSKIILLLIAAGLIGVVLYLPQIVSIINKILFCLSPIFSAIIIAYVLNIPMIYVEGVLRSKNDKDSFLYQHSRGLAITVSVIIFLALFVLICSFVLPELVDSIANLVSNLNGYFNNLTGYLSNVAEYFGLDTKALQDLSVEEFLKSIGLDYSQLMKNASEWLVGTGTGAIGQILNFGTALFNFMMSFMIALYFLSSKETLIRQLKMSVRGIFSKRFADRLLEDATLANDIFRNFVGSRGIDIMLVWIMMYIGLLIAQIPFAILISTICALLCIIPVFGSLIATIISCILLVSIKWWYAVIFYIIQQIVLNLEANVIYPRFAGKSIGLPPVWILASVIVAGYIGGPIWILCAVPITACAYTFFSRFIHSRLDQRGIEVPPEEIVVPKKRK